VKQTETSPEQALIFALLRGEPVIDLHRPDQQDPDLQELYRLFHRHRLFPLSASIQPLLPKHEQEVWKEARLWRDLHALKLAAQLEELLPLFREKDIPVRPLKGPELARELYGDLQQRHMRDLDLLVREEELPRALQVLEEAGFQLYSPPKALSPQGWKRYFRQHYDLGLKHRESGLILELHTRLNYPWLLEKGKKLFSGEEGGHEREELFLYLLIHGSHHLYFRLFWLRDVAEALKRWTLDHDWVLERSLQLGAERMLGLSLELARDIFASEIPLNYGSLLEKEKVSLNKLRKRAHRAIRAPRFRSPAFRWNVLRFTMQLRPGLRHRWHSLSSVAVRWWIRNR